MEVILQSTLAISCWSSLLHEAVLNTDQQMIGTFPDTIFSIPKHIPLSKSDCMVSAFACTVLMMILRQVRREDVVRGKCACRCEAHFPVRG